MPEDATNHPPKLTVLVVEDEPVACQCLARLLQLQGYRTETASTLALAETKLDGQAVIVLDLELPDGLGTALLTKIRSQHPRMRVVILSGAPESLMREAAALQPDMLLRKPLEVPVLLEWLRAQRARGAADAD